MDPARFPAVIGCDEVGRGALCGPVVVAAVWFDPVAVPAELLAQLDDSKRLTARQRDRVSALVTACSRVAVAANSVARIDQHGIRAMTLDAMRKAVERLQIDAPVHIDGVDIPEGLQQRAVAVVRGEQTTPQIAAASVVAKTFRDRLIARLATRYAQYGWHNNAGYGTAQHLAALALHGATPHHRRSFSPVSHHAPRARMDGPDAMTDALTESDPTR